jgi:hypothetical protein
MSHSKSGAALAVELRKLLEAADAADEMAEVYLAVNNAVSGTDEDSVTAFQTQMSGQPAGLSSAGRAWISLRDQFQGIMGESYLNLRETAQALRHTVADYLSTDAEAADRLADSYDGRLPALDDRPGYEYPQLPPGYQPTTRADDEQRKGEEGAS